MSRRTMEQRTLAAEVRAVEEGHRARRVGGDLRARTVASDTLPGVRYRVRVAMGTGDTVVFTCDHGCYDRRTGQLVVGREPERTFVPCKHGSVVARQLARHVLLSNTGGRWVPTDKARRLGVAPPVDTSDPFAGLPGCE